MLGERVAHVLAARHLDHFLARADERRPHLVAHPFASAATRIVVIRRSIGPTPRTGSASAGDAVGTGLDES